MKELNITVGKPQLKILTGIELDLNDVFVKNNQGHRCVKNPKCMLWEIVDSKIIPLSKSSDERFDKKDIIIQAIESIQKHGLTKILIDKICKHKQSAKYGRLMGVYSFLNGILTDEHKAKISIRLKSAYKYFEQYGSMP